MVRYCVNVIEIYGKTSGNAVTINTGPDHSEPVCLLQYMPVIVDEITRIIGEDSLNRITGPILKRIFQHAYRQARIIFISGNKRAPAGNFHIQWNILIFQFNNPKRETSEERTLFKPRQSIIPVTQTISTTMRAKQFPGRND
ncbi:hypothetical protein SDC9_97166 [bioreactor metagenome]|uniref:Uncharacterized protein n=1 Tax=bioreactor metagenome TaxID=1076179 RepID=A0A645ABM5_9ZZZZ